MMGDTNKMAGGSVDFEANLNRLATPKAVHPSFIPDKPSIYWLDYLVDPEPHHIVNPSELQSYYQKFETPTLQRLSKPKLTLPSECSLLKSKQPLSTTGISLSALRYVPSPRIRQLAEPRTQPGFNLRGTKSCANEMSSVDHQTRPSKRTPRPSSRN